MISESEFLKKITDIVPSERQISIGDMEYYNFIHFGLNTFTGKEWGSGKVSPDVFPLKDINIEKWVTDLKSTGSKGIVITAKHHDGFCLFPSKYTEYSIKNTVYKDGRGDIVGELSAACKKHGMKFGVYLSPWDRHENTYGTPEYNDFYVNQLTELCSNYGELFCLWFDGACGEGENGKKQEYDWKRYFSVIRELQPNACITNCGPDLRWIGNEHGKCRKFEFSVVPGFFSKAQDIAENSQQKEGATAMLKKVPSTQKNMGQRETLPGEDLAWYPSEMDIPITYFGWFYRPFFELFLTRSKRNLMRCYYNSVGHNATVILNVPPNKKGELPKKFIKRIVGAKKALEKRFSHPVTIDTRFNHDEITAAFSKCRVNAVVLAEDITKSQRIEEYEIYADGKKVFDGTTVGRKNICRFRSVKCSEIVIKVTKTRAVPYIKSIRVYADK